MHPFAGLRYRPEQLRRRARDPAPDDAGQFVIAALQPFRLLFGDADRAAAVAAVQEEGSLPGLALVGPHHALNPGAPVRFHRNVARLKRAQTLPKILLLATSSILHPGCARGKASYNRVMADLFDSLPRKTPGPANGALGPPANSTAGDS